MKTQEEILMESERLLTLFMNPTTKKPLHDKSFTEYHKLQWVLRDEEDITKKRLREINVTGNKESVSE